MSAIAPSSNVIPSIYTTQSASAYPANIDGNCIAGLRVWGAFAPRAQTTPNMTMIVDPGHLLGSSTLLEMGAYTTGTTTTSSGVISGVPASAFAGIAAGMVVQAWYYSAGVFTNLYADNTYVTTASQSAGTVTVNHTASASQGASIIFGQPIGAITTGNISGSAVTSLGTTSGIVVGMAVSGTGVTGGTTVTSLNTSTGTATLSVTATTGTGITLTFSVPTQSTNPRIDRVCVNSTTGVPTWVAGTPAASPSPPAIPSGYIPCCQLLIGTATTAITMTSVVADERDLTTLGGGGGIGVQTSLASASTTDLGTISSHNVLITGTTTITGLGSSATTSSPIYELQFGGALTLTYNATSLIVPGSSNIVTTSGDTARALYLGSGNWRILSYNPADGSPISMTGAEVTLASAATTDLGTANSQVVAISGTSAITSFGSTANISNPIYFVRFTGALTLTYNATSMILPGASSIVTVAGDTAIAQYMGSGNWRVREYIRASGAPTTPQIHYSVITSTGTFTTPTGTTSGTVFEFTIVGDGGGGGGGGTSSGASEGGGGGGAGATALYYGTGVAAGTNVSVTVGTGGAGGATSSSGTNGSGTVVVFGSTTVTAGGGIGGSAYNTNLGGGGLGGTTTNATFGMPGGGGGAASVGVAGDPIPGQGGASSMGGGGFVVHGVPATPGSNGSAPGSGGTGGGNSGTGGQGASGVVIVKWVQ